MYTCTCMLVINKVTSSVFVKTAPSHVLCIHSHAAIREVQSHIVATSCSSIFPRVPNFIDITDLSCL